MSVDSLRLSVDSLQLSVKIMYVFSKYQFIVFLSSIYICGVCVCVCFAALVRTFGVILIVGDKKHFCLGTWECFSSFIIKYEVSAEVSMR